MPNGRVKGYLVKQSGEYAVRGGLIGKRYSWGDDESVARDYANYNGTGGKDKWKGWPTASTTLRLIRTTTLGFDVCQDFRAIGPLTLGRA